MSKVLVTESSLIGIATAIRTKNGTQNSYKPGQMAAAIEALPDPSVLVSKSITQNGSYDPEDDSADGYSAVTVNVPNSYAAGDEGKVVSNGALVQQTARASEITLNGTYDTTLNDEVTVNVSGGGGGASAKLSIGSTNPIINASGVIGPMSSYSSEYLIPKKSDGTNEKPDLHQPFEVCCRFKLPSGGVGSTTRNAFGSSNNYYDSPVVSVYKNNGGFCMNYGAEGTSGWSHDQYVFSDSGYTVPNNTWLTAKMTYDGTDITFFASDGTHDFSMTINNTVPRYNSGYTFCFGGQNKSVFSIAGVGAYIDLDGTYIKQGNTVIWGGGAA